MRRTLYFAAAVAAMMLGPLAGCSTSDATKGTGTVISGSGSTTAGSGGVVADVNAALASPGAKQGFAVFCVGTKFVLAQVQGISVSADQKAGIDEADSIIHGICDAGPPGSALQLALSLGKVAVEDQYLRALVAKALGG